MSAPREPVNSELVAVAWALSVPGVPAGKVSMGLPAAAEWTTYITVDGIVGGNPHPDAPIRQPVVQYSCWARNPGSDTHPPWGSAFVLAERLVRCTESDSEHRAKVLTIRDPFEQATLRDATAITEPARFPIPDPASYARVRVDIQLIWTRLTSPEVHT
jgi:hypothetical protein